MYTTGFSLAHVFYSTRSTRSDIKIPFRRNVASQQISSDIL